MCTPGGEYFDPRDPAWDSSFVYPEAMALLDALEARLAAAGCDVWGFPLNPEAAGS